MDNKKIYMLIAFLIAMVLILGIGLYFSSGKSEQPKPVVIRERVIDTIIKPHEVLITNTRMGKNIYIDTTDTVRVKQLIKLTDSLESLISSMNSGMKLRCDSILIPQNDTVSIVFDKYKNKLDTLTVKHKPIEVRIMGETQIVKEEVPFSRYLLVGGGGLVLGILLTLFVRG